MASPLQPPLKEQPGCRPPATHRAPPASTVDLGVLTDRSPAKKPQYFDEF